MNIEYHYITEEFELPQKQNLENIITKIFSDYNKIASDLNYIFCDDEYLLDVNKTYLNHNYYTDVITFENSHDELPSDIFISIDRIKENAKTYEATFEAELHRVMIHGVLHLCGVNDKTDDEFRNMKEQETHYLKLLANNEF